MRNSPERMQSLAEQCLAAFRATLEFDYLAEEPSEPLEDENPKTRYISEWREYDKEYPCRVSYWMVQAFLCGVTQKEIARNLGFNTGASVYRRFQQFLEIFLWPSELKSYRRRHATAVETRLALKVACERFLSDNARVEPYCRTDA